MCLLTNGRWLEALTPWPHRLFSEPLRPYCVLFSIPVAYGFSEVQVLSKKKHDVTKILAVCLFWTREHGEPPISIAAPPLVFLGKNVYHGEIYISKIATYFVAEAEYIRKLKV